MKAQTIALTGVALLLAVVALAVVASTHSSSEAAPRCDGPNPPRQCATATPTVTPTLTVTPTPTASPTPTPTPPTPTLTATPTRVPGEFDVEVSLGISDNTFIAGDWQAFTITTSVYNHGDNASAQAGIIIELRFSSTSGIGFASMNSRCPSVNTYGWQSSNINDANIPFRMSVDSPGLYANGVGPAWQAACVYTGFFTDGSSNNPPAASDTVTIEAVLLGTDGFNLNNSAVKVVKVIIP